MLDGCVKTWNFLPYYNNLFVGYVIEQITTLLLLLFLAFTFRARRSVTDGPLYDPRGYTGSAYEHLLDRAEASESYDSTATSTFSNDVATGSRIVIANPDSQVDCSTGKITGTVSLAEPFEAFDVTHHIAPELGHTVADPPLR